LAFYPFPSKDGFWAPYPSFSGPAIPLHCPEKMAGPGHPVRFFFPHSPGEWSGRAEKAEGLPSPFPLRMLNNISFPPGEASVPPPLRRFVVFSFEKKLLLTPIKMTFPLSDRPNGPVIVEEGFEFPLLSSIFFCVKPPAQGPPFAPLEGGQFECTRFVFVFCAEKAFFF